MLDGRSMGPKRLTLRGIAAEIAYVMALGGACCLLILVAFLAGR